jgi:LysR family glycine cleavage system transcriptional activator
MARRYYQLPSLTGLNTFDACARHGSFTAAAGELGVTLGAVSRQVKALEAELDCPLFLRLHRGVELTAEGIDLFQTLSSSFQQIGRLCQKFRNRAGSAEVTLAATTAFASLWLMPRIGGFWQQYHDINLNHAISDNPLDSGFLNADIRIRYGDGNWRGEHSIRLFDDRIYPVCGRAFAEQHDLHNELDSSEDLLEHPLLQLDGVDPVWTGWELPLAQWNCDVRQAIFRRFNNYVVALQAAEENQGILLGWHSLVAALVERGKLVRIGGMEIKAPGSFYLSWAENRPLSESASRLHDWLLVVGGQQ